MRKPRRGIVLSLVVSFLALGLAIYGARVSPADAPPPKPMPAPLPAARFFVMLPDGRVEITDGFSRRVFKWDGHQWIQVESLTLPRLNQR